MKEILQNTIKLFLLSFPILLLPFMTFSQCEVCATCNTSTTTGCTISVTSNSSVNYTVNLSNKMCITGGTYTGNLTLNGGIVVVGSGVIFNPASFTISQINGGTLEIQHGATANIPNNSGIIINATTPMTFTLNNCGRLYLYQSVWTMPTNTGGVLHFNNNGIVYSSYDWNFYGTVLPTICNSDSLTCTTFILNSSLPSGIAVINNGFMNTYDLRQFCTFCVIDICSCSLWQMPNNFPWQTHGIIDGLGSCGRINGGTGTGTCDTCTVNGNLDICGTFNNIGGHIDSTVTHCTCGSGSCAGPLANFTCSDTTFCSVTNKCINFYDHSTGNPTSWHWTFFGATPDTSSLQNPDSICYNTPGTYPVILVASNANGSDTLNVYPMITFGNSVTQPTIIISGGDTLVSSHGSTYQWYLNGIAIAGATDSFYVEHQNGTYSVQISDNTGGCHAISGGLPVGVIELSGGESVIIFPNPFDDELTIKASPTTPRQMREEELEIIIYDIASQKIMDQKFTTSLSINTKHLAKGVYIYEIKNVNGAIERGKIVKE